MKRINKMMKIPTLRVPLGGNFTLYGGQDLKMPIVDQYAYVEMSKDCSWDSHIAKVIGKGTVHLGKMNAILTDSHLDSII